MGDLILLLGVEAPLDQDLKELILTEDREVRASPLLSPAENRALISRLRPGLVFLGGDWRRQRELLNTRVPPIVVVSRSAEVSDWLDAIEAGARDYCAPPFERAHVRWILESALRGRAAAA